MSIQSPSREDLIDEFNAVIDGDPRYDRHNLYERLRHDLPAFWSEKLDAWVFTRYEDVKEVLGSDDRFGRPVGRAGSSVYGRSFLEMKGREHNKKVGIVAKEIRAPRAIKEHLDGMIEKIVNERVEALTYGEPIDLREVYNMWIPLLAITELVNVHEAGKFEKWYHAIAAGGVASIANPAARDAAFVARDEVREFLAPIIAERKLNPGTDLISQLLLAEYEGEPLPDDEVAAAVIFLLTAGVETTERVLTSTLRYLALNPDAWEEAVSRRDDPIALSALSAEALRMFPPVNGLVRSAHGDQEVGGTVVKHDERVVPLLVSGNRDESMFSDPHRFDPNRFADNPTRQFGSAGEVLPFGAGPHHCTGSRLAEVEMVHAFEKLFKNVSRMIPDGELPASTGFILHSPPALPVILERRV